MDDEINLLPNQFKSRRVRALYLSRLGRLLNRLYIPLLFLVIGQGLVYYSLLLVRDNLIESTALSEKETSQVFDEVNEINQILGKLINQVDQIPTWSDRIESILGLIPESVNLLSMKVVEKDHSLTVRGVTSSRAAVIGLREELESLPWVERLEAPLANFALEPDSEFSFIIHGNEPI